MEFRVTTEFLNHSTKFYQLFRIERFNNGRFEGRAVTVGHYGSHNAIRGLLGDSRRPISGGQCAVYPGAKHSEKRAEKLRKGYEPEGAPRLYDYNTEEHFRRWLSETMPTKVRNEILATLSLPLDANAQPIDPDDQPIAALETTDNEPEERPDGWGDW